MWGVLLVNGVLHTIQAQMQIAEGYYNPKVGYLTIYTLNPCVSLRLLTFRIYA